IFFSSSSFFFSSRRRHTRSLRDWSSDVCSSDLALLKMIAQGNAVGAPRILERAYARAAADEADAAASLRVVIEQHPAWPWLESRSEERRVGKECRSRWMP